MLKNIKFINTIITITVIGDIMNTTIAISTEIRDKIREFGNKGESYTQILEKLYKSACERQLQELLMDTSDSIPVSEALKKAKKKWQ